MALKQYLVIKDAGVFDATGSLRPLGSIATLDSDKVGDNPKHVAEIDGNAPVPVNVQIAAVAPSGPNPVNPQQIPPDAQQTIRGYEQPGARLVGEVTNDAKIRIEAAELLDDGDDSQGQIVEQLAEAKAEANKVVKPDPLDHDENGKKGGSKPRVQAEAKEAGK